jgi:large subunit ribosomal protein L14
MVQLRSILKSADNTGAKKLMVIQVMGGWKRYSGTMGDVVNVVVKEAAPDGTVKRGEKAKAVLIRTRKESRRKDGSYIRFDDNAAVIIDAQGNPRGTRIFGPVSREVKEAGFNKIASMAKELF